MPDKIISKLPDKVRWTTYEGVAGFVAAFLGTLAVDAAFALELGALKAALIAGATALIEAFRELASEVQDDLRERRQARATSVEA